MRIIIEVEEGQPPRVAQAMGDVTAGPAAGVRTAASAGAAVEAGTANGGAPAEDLFKALGVEAPPADATYLPASAAALAAPPAADGGMDGGAAPAWLWPGAAPSQSPVGEAAPLDGGASNG